MKHYSLLIFFTSLTISLNAQSKCDCYERLAALAEYQLEKRQYDEAYSTLVRASKYQDASLIEENVCWMLAEAAQRTGKAGEGKSYLMQLAKFGVTADDIKQDTLFAPLADEIFIKEYITAAGKDKLRVNALYFARLQELKNTDQAIRNDTTWMNNTAKFRQADSLNFEKLKALIAQYGFPNMKDHGIRPSEITPMLLHASRSDIPGYHQQVLDMLEKAHEKGYVRRSSIAMVIDRHREWPEKLQQKYGAWGFTQSAPAVEDFNSVDNNRYQQNMLSYGDMCATYHHKMPDGYKSKPYPKEYFCK